MDATTKALAERKPLVENHLNNVARLNFALSPLVRTVINVSLSWWYVVLQQ